MSTYNVSLKQSGQTKIVEHFHGLYRKLHIIEVGKIPFAAQLVFSS